MYCPLSSFFCKGGHVKVLEPDEREGVAGAWRGALDVDVHQLAISPENSSHLFICDVELGVAGKQGPSSQGIMFRVDVVKVVGEPVRLFSPVTMWHRWYSSSVTISMVARWRSSWGPPEVIPMPMARSPPVRRTSEHVISTTTPAASRRSPTVPGLLSVFISVPVRSSRSPIATTSSWS